MTRLPLNQLTLNKWIIYTTAGWILGVLLVIVLGSLPGQSSVGAGMGAGVGLLQWIVLRKHAGTRAGWFLLSFIGLLLPFLLFDLISIYVTGMKPETYLPIAVLIGALLVGWLQYKIILNRHYHQASNWILMNVLGWFAASVITSAGYALNPHLPRSVGLPLAFILLVIGGPIVGLISGPTIINCLKRTKTIEVEEQKKVGITTIIQPGSEPTKGSKTHKGDSIG